MIREKVKIVNKLGLHARASSVLSQKACEFGSRIELGPDDHSLVDCKSIMALMMLAAGIGTEMVLRVEGDDEHLAFEQISQLIADRFGEDE